MAKRGFFKRVNRGLLLAAAVFTMLVVYLTVNGLAFTAAKPEVLAFLREYNQTIAQFNVAEAGNVVAGQQLPQQAQSRLLAQGNEIAAKYYDVEHATEIAWSLEEYVKQYGVNACVWSFSINIEKIVAFKQLGHNYVSCTVKYSSNAKISGDSGSALYYADNYGYYYGNTPTEGQPAYDITKIEDYSNKGRITYVLKRTGQTFAIISEQEVY